MFQRPKYLDILHRCRVSVSLNDAVRKKIIHPCCILHLHSPRMWIKKKYLQADMFYVATQNVYLANLKYFQIVRGARPNK